MSELGINRDHYFARLGLLNEPLIDSQGLTAYIVDRQWFVTGLSAKDFFQIVVDPVDDSARDIQSQLGHKRHLRSTCIDV
jgi:hypothetical protein